MPDDFGYATIFSEGSVPKPPKAFNKLQNALPQARQLARRVFADVILRGGEVDWDRLAYGR
jgi:hypothetical protein